MITRFFIGISRHIRDALRNFFRGFGLNISALASINVTLLVVGASVLMGLNFNAFADDIENDVEIIATLKKDIKETAIDELKSKFGKDKRIKEYTFSSRADELASVVKDLPSLKTIAGQYEGEENPLYDVFYIKINDVKDVKGLVKDLNGNSAFEEIKYGEEVVNQVVTLFTYARIIALVVIISLVLVTIFIIYNTIRITIYTRSDQVDIMRLIGASNYHIVMPYIYEGVIIGVLGAIVPMAITYFSYTYFYNTYANSKIIKVFIDLVEPTPVLYYILAGLLIIGVGVGILGSGLSVKRYLKR